MLRERLDAASKAREGHDVCVCDHCVTRLMEAALVGKDYGLDLAHARLDGATEVELMGWEYVSSRMRRD